MSIKGLWRALTGFEKILWITSSIVVTVCYFLAPTGNILSLIASLFGAAALIFSAKGYVAGQAFAVVFAVLYGIISWEVQYYGEMITYLGMSAPIALISIFSWLRHPYKKSAEVTVSRLRKKHVIGLALLAVGVTTAFYFILGALDTANLPVSTLSVTTSFVAAALLQMRSPYYAIAYAVNDIVLITLWSLVIFEDSAAIPMIVCFLMFLVNDFYGFYNWRRMQKRQQSDQA